MLLIAIAIDPCVQTEGSESHLTGTLHLPHKEKAVTAHLESKQLLFFAFAETHGWK